MKTIIVSFGVLALLVLPAAGQDKEEERVANAGTVIGEIMNIPDNVPQDTIDKADCVVVLPWSSNWLSESVAATAVE